eukprot:9606010-Lingulodinium_polyedra.AAC.1
MTIRPGTQTFGVVDQMTTRGTIGHGQRRGMRASGLWTMLTRSLPFVQDNSVGVPLLAQVAQ